LGGGRKLLGVLQHRSTNERAATAVFVLCSLSIVVKKNRSLPVYFRLFCQASWWALALSDIRVLGSALKFFGKFILWA